MRERFVPLLHAHQPVRKQRGNALIRLLGKIRSGLSANHGRLRRCHGLYAAAFFGHFSLGPGGGLSSLSLCHLRFDFGDKEPCHRIPRFNERTFFHGHFAETSRHLSRNRHRSRVHHSLQRHRFRRHRLPHAPSNKKHRGGRKRQPRRHLQFGLLHSSSFRFFISPPSDPRALTNH